VISGHFDESAGSKQLLSGDGVKHATLYRETSRPVCLDQEVMAHGYGQQEWVIGRPLDGMRVLAEIADAQGTPVHANNLSRQTDFEPLIGIARI
jgi:hypothetical protein